MKALIQKLACFMREEDGVTALEYGLLAALIAVAIIAGATTLGNGLSDMFEGLPKCFPTPSACANGVPGVSGG